MSIDSWGVPSNCRQTCRRPCLLVVQPSAITGASTETPLGVRERFLTRKSASWLPRELPLLEVARIKPDEAHVVAAVAYDEGARVAGLRVGVGIDVHRAGVVASGADHDVCRAGRANKGRIEEGVEEGRRPVRGLRPCDKQRRLGRLGRERREASLGVGLAQGRWPFPSHGSRGSMPESASILRTTRSRPS